MNIFFTFRIFNNFRLPWKQSFPWNFSLCWIYFLLFRISEQRRLPWKEKNCPEIFHFIEYTFYIQEFWTTCVWPEKQRGPWIQSTEYIFYIIKDFEQLPLALKNRVALKIFTVFKYFLSFRIFGQLALALKTEFAIKFFKPPPPPTPRLVRLRVQLPVTFQEDDSI